jgi:alkaline phosphatase D
MFFLSRTFVALFSLTLISLSVHAGLSSSPMLGHVDMREATVWVQTDEPSIIRVSYTESEDATDLIWSLPTETDRANGNTAHIILDKVEPGKRYEYRIEIDGTLENTVSSFETPPFHHNRTPPPDIRIAIGGAHYVMEEGFEPPYQILGGGYNIFSAIEASNPELMLWVGNTAHLRESDWASKSGYLKRYRQARSTPKLSALLANTPNYATWGSADYSLGNEGRHYSFREHAESSFKAFWPQPVSVSALDGIATRFRRSDVDFFVLDVRSYRNDTPDTEELPVILGKEQIEWLRQELLRSTATFKVIVAGAPILNPAKSRENLSYAIREHTDFLQMLRDERISGLFFISGGKYYGEMTRLVHANSYNLYDLTVGPLTANPKDNNDELNFFRMPGSSSFERHYALIDISGPEENRLLTVRVMSTEGKELWSRNIKASQLQPAGQVD